jgi:hypothetical protein
MIFFYLNKREIIIKVLKAFSIIFLLFIIWLLVGGWQGIIIMNKMNQSNMQNILANYPNKYIWYSLTDFNSMKTELYRLYLSISGFNIYWYLLGIGIKFRFLITFIVLNLLIIGIAIKSNVKNKKVLFLSLITFIPLILMIIRAIIEGNTVALASRYYSFSVIFGIILFILGLIRLYKFKIKILNVLIFIVFSLNIFVMLFDSYLKYHSIVPKNDYIILSSNINNIKDNKVTVIFPNIESLLISNIYFYNSKLIIEEKIQDNAKKEIIVNNIKYNLSEHAPILTHFQ